MIPHHVKMGTSYLAFDGTCAADGYMFVRSPGSAVVFPSEESVVDFLTESGPGWALSMTKSGHIRHVPVSLAA